MMAFTRWWGGAALLLTAIAVGCGSDDATTEVPDGSAADGSAGTGGSGTDANPDSKPDTSAGGTAGKAGNAGSGGNAGGAGTGGVAQGGTAGAQTGGTAGSQAGTGGEPADGSAGNPNDAGCVQVGCQNHVYECGDCLDNDNDGLIDMADPDCLGPCHNSEVRFDLGIPGGGNAPCKLDCYYDQDTGAGNDDCYWSHECDPLEVAPNYYPEGDGCKYDKNANTPGTNKTCAELYAAQSQTCTNICGPLTPNGCDCFGCCELPPGGGKYVWLGSFNLLSDGGAEPSCDLKSMADPSKCHPCTPVAGCLNTCQHCELCLGKTELPADCFPPPPDAGVGGAGGQPGTGGSGGQTGTGGTTGTGGSGTGGTGGTIGTGGSGGTPGCGGQICPVGSQPCGLSCQPPCPGGYFCLTGCCQKSPA